MGSTAGALYQALANAGGAPKDFSAMIRFLDGKPA
jgi:3-hydroxyisobutyrate dehydrogenase-like beta-hydroxyacid dehydrogenase